MNYVQDDWKVYEHGWWQTNNGYEHGVVFTKYGIIYVYRQWPTNGEHWPANPATIIEIVLSRQTYRRTWDRCYSRRYCITLAKRMGREITIRNNVDLIKEAHKAGMKRIPAWAESP